MGAEGLIVGGIGVIMVEKATGAHRSVGCDIRPALVRLVQHGIHRAADMAHVAAGAGDSLARSRPGVALGNGDIAPVPVAHDSPVDIAQDKEGRRISRNGHRKGAERRHRRSCPEDSAYLRILAESGAGFWPIIVAIAAAELIGINPHLHLRHTARRRRVANIGQGQRWIGVDIAVMQGGGLNVIGAALAKAVLFERVGQIA